MKSMLITIFSLFSIQLFAQDAVFYSRNMPRSCEYVFAVESDLRLELPLNSPDQEVYYQIQNTWEPSQWTETKSLSLKTLTSKLVGELTLTSMSIPGHFLYRIIAFSFPNSQKKCVADFGREFGEACHNEGRDVTPWRLRQLNCTN